MMNDALIGTSDCESPKGIETEVCSRSFTHYDCFFMLLDSN